MEERQTLEKTSDVQPTPVGNKLPTWMIELDGDLFEGSNGKQGVRKEKRRGEDSSYNLILVQELRQVKKRGLEIEM